MHLTIVTTLYRSVPYIYEFYQRMSNAAGKVTKDYEIVFINDGSDDESLEKAVEILNEVVLADASHYEAWDSLMESERDLADALMNMSKLNFEQKNYLGARAFMQRYEASTEHNAETLLLAFKIETASNNKRTANTYKLMLESNFPESTQTAEVRRLSGR